MPFQMHMCQQLGTWMLRRGYCRIGSISQVFMHLGVASALARSSAAF